MKAWMVKNEPQKKGKARHKRRQQKAKALKAMMRVLKQGI